MNFPEKRKFNLFYVFRKSENGPYDSLIFQKKENHFTNLHSSNMHDGMRKNIFISTYNIKKCL